MHLRWAHRILPVSGPQVCVEVLLVCRQYLPLDGDLRVLQARRTGYTLTGNLHLLFQLFLPYKLLLFER